MSECFSRKVSWFFFQALLIFSLYNGPNTPWPAVVFMVGELRDEMKIHPASAEKGHRKRVFNQSGDDTAEKCHIKMEAAEKADDLSDVCSFCSQQPLWEDTVNYIEAAAWQRSIMLSQEAEEERRCRRGRALAGGAATNLPVSNEVWGLSVGRVQASSISLIHFH